MSEFRLLKAMYQEPGRQYILVPRVSDPVNGNYGAQASDMNVTEECMIDLHSNQEDCSYRLMFLVKYDKESCCEPACLHGGECLTSGNCSCNNFWYGNQCTECKTVLLMKYNFF